MSIHGYQSYRPSPIAQAVLEASFQICAQYKAWESPLTVRQIFYRLVQERGYAKTENDYKALVNMIARSRRARQGFINDKIDRGLDLQEASDLALENHTLIPFSWIRDEKGQGIDALTYDDYDDFMENARRQAEEMRLDAQEGQKQILEIWCEAAGMVPLMREIGSPWTLRVNSGGGYDSVTAKHELARRVIHRPVPTVVLHIGDFDPSGEGMYETLRDDVGQMAYELMPEPGWLTVERVALTEEQVIKMNIETAPPKKKDARRAGFVKRHPKARKHFKSDDITAQLEALTPPELRSLIQGTIESYIDQDEYESVRQREDEIREDLLAKLED